MTAIQLVIIATGAGEGGTAVRLDPPQQHSEHTMAPQVSSSGLSARDKQIGQSDGEESWHCGTSSSAGKCDGGASSHKRRFKDSPGGLPL